LGRSRANFETYGFSLEQKFPQNLPRVSGELLNSEAVQTVGTFFYLPLSVPTLGLSGLREHLDYREESLLLTPASWWATMGVNRALSTEPAV